MHQSFFFFFERVCFFSARETIFFNKIMQSIFKSFRGVFQLREEFSQGNPHTQMPLQHVIKYIKEEIDFFPVHFSFRHFLRFTSSKYYDEPAT